MMRLSCLIVLFLFTCGSAQAENYRATYDVYAGGIHALQARLSVADNGKSYDISIESETYGILDKIVPWHATLSTQGHHTPGKRLPLTHVADTVTRSKHETNTYRYDAKGRLEDFKQVVDGEDTTLKDIDPSITDDTVDVISAVFGVIDRVEAGKPCTAQNLIFDSERSYGLKFTDGTKDTLLPGKYSSFSGAAQSCHFEVVPEGGKWHKKPRGWMKIQDQAKKSGQPPSIWFGNVGTSGKPVFAPVKVLVKTDLGAFVAHLTSFQDKSAK